jgi:hypothetical protein
MAIADSRRPRRCGPSFGLRGCLREIEREAFPCRRADGVGDPGLEPGTSSLSEKNEGCDRSRRVVKRPANRNILVGPTEHEAVRPCNLVHPWCTPEPRRRRPNPVMAD